MLINPQAALILKTNAQLAALLAAPDNYPAETAMIEREIGRRLGYLEYFAGRQPLSPAALELRSEAFAAGYAQGTKEARSDDF
jgi:hypothetical protein